MREIERSEILDLGAYEQVRDRFRDRVIALKKTRRVAVGEHMTFLFENRDTVLLQIQEMLRTERITREEGIAHEIETYNTMLPGEGELFATLMIEVEDKVERAKLLDALADLRSHVVLDLAGQRVAGEFEMVPGEEEGRLPAVNYVRFRVGPGAAAVLEDEAQAAALVVDHPAYRVRTELSATTRAELARDLAEG